MNFNLQQLQAALEQDLIQNTGLLTPRPDFTLHLVECIPSTNQYLWELLDQGATEGTVVLALQQTAGRGQWGRQWVSTQGGLYLSIGLTPNLPAAQVGQLTLCSAWGIAAALRHQYVPVRLKWPNDLVINHRKLGGILTETRVQQGRVTQAVIGIGLNWRNPVPETGINLQEVLQEQPLTRLDSLEMLTALVLQGVMAAYRCWQQQGIAAILPAYQALLTQVGRSLQVQGHSGHRQSGHIIGVSPEGALRVRLSDTDHPGLSSEVLFQPGTLSLGYD